MDINVPADQIGRYAIDSLKGDVFKAALDFGTTDSTQPGVETTPGDSRRPDAKDAAIYWRMCCKFVVEAKICVDDRQLLVFS
jgi:hypothetical protein